MISLVITSIPITKTGRLLFLFGGCTYWIIKLSLPDTNAYHQLYFLCLLQYNPSTAKWSFHLPPLWPLHNFLILTMLLFILIGWPKTHFINWISEKALAIISWVHTGAVFLICFSYPLVKGNKFRVGFYFFFFWKIHIYYCC